MQAVSDDGFMKKIIIVVSLHITINVFSKPILIKEKLKGPFPQREKYF